MIVELNVIVQVQHINSNKYNNSFKSRVQTLIRDEINYRILQCKGHEILIPHVKRNAGLYLMMYYKFLYIP
jgi:hypothetical protein